MSRSQAPMGVLLVDDHAMVRRGMRDFLGLHADLAVVGDAADGAEAVAPIDALHPDVVVMDLLMPVMDGIAAHGLSRADRADRADCPARSGRSRRS